MLLKKQNQVKILQFLLHTMHQNTPLSFKIFSFLNKNVEFYLKFCEEENLKLKIAFHSDEFTSLISLGRHLDILGLYSSACNEIVVSIIVESRRLKDVIKIHLLPLSIAVKEALGLICETNSK